MPTAEAVIDAAAEVIRLYGGRDYMHRQLAELQEVRLPEWGEEATAQKVWWWIQRLGIAEEDFLAWAGWETPSSMVDNNPVRPLRCYVGELLECLDCNPVPEDDVDFWRANELALDGDEKIAPLVPGIKTSFQDAGAWEDLAAWAGVELPPWDEPITQERMAEVLHALRVSVKSYQALTGDGEIIHFKYRNPRWPLRAWSGIVLEWVSVGQLAWRTAKTREVKSGKA